MPTPAPILIALALLCGCAAVRSAELPHQDAPDTNSLERPDGRIGYQDSGGSGRLLVLVPGMGDLRGEYRFLTPILRQAGYRVVTMDIRGHGDSSADWKDYSAHAVGSDVLALIDALGEKRAVVIGTSFAAGAALWAAHDQPEKISGLVMIGPVLRDQQMPFYMRPLLYAMFTNPWRVNIWLSYWDSLFPSRKPSDQEAYRAALAANLREPGRMDALKKMVLLSKADTAAIITRLDQPALIVMGSKDPDFADPAAEAKFLAERTGAKIVMVEGAGHYPQAEMPEQISAPLLAYLQGLR